MKSWHSRIIADPDDLSLIVAALAYFDAEYREACEEMKQLRGLRLTEAQARLPGIVGYRYEQLAELDAIIAFIEIREDAMVGVQRRFYIEHYNRKLTDAMVNKFAESHSDVIALRETRNRVTAVRNKFLALSKHHEHMHYQLGNLSKLWAAGVADAIL
jgi:hypothetical protein